jgi:hypothetical protein
MHSSTYWCIQCDLQFNINLNRTAEHCMRKVCFLVQFWKTNTRKFFEDFNFLSLLSLWKLTRAFNILLCTPFKPEPFLFTSARARPNPFNHLSFLTYLWDYLRSELHYQNGSSWLHFQDRSICTNVHRLRKQEHTVDHDIGCLEKTEMEIQQAVVHHKLR